MILASEFTDLLFSDSIQSVLGPSVGLKLPYQRHPVDRPRGSIDHK